MKNVGHLDRLEDFISLAKKGTKVQLEVNLHKQMVKELAQTEGTDDITDEKVINLFIADFVRKGAEGKPTVVRKMYSFNAINETEVDAKTTTHIANERLKMDYKRLKDAGIVFTEKYF